MARVNLRAAFMSGMASTISAQQVFTDRVDEVSAFERSLNELQRTLDEADVSPVADRTQGRRNILAFYGVGGIGKSTLSHELERQFLPKVAARNRHDTVSVRIDLSEDGATDLEHLLLRIRAGLGQLGGHWLAFDLALASYWARAHPGEALQEFIDTLPALRRVSRSVALSEQIASSVEQVVPLAGLAQRAVLGAYRAIRDRVRSGRLLTECELFAEIIEADADYESLSFYPYLLAWELERYSSQRRRPWVCIFLDTFEVLGDRIDRTVERFIQRCAYLMPNALFVITGRNRIDWADSESSGELDFQGPECWPNLHFTNNSIEPRQHLVGYLSDSDADSYLREALITDDEPAVPAEIRQRIIESGQGLPLYLDLSVSHFLEQLARGRQPTLDDFGGSFTAVATRSIRDLPREERDLVRTAALIDRFDAGLLRAGQPSLADGWVARFLRRPLLTHDDAYELPYALHASLRSAIKDADRGLPDGWSDRDRAEVADRLLRHLGTRLGPTVGRAAIAQALESGLRLSGKHGVFNDWLVRATQRLVEAGQWMVIGTDLTSGPGEGDELRALQAAIRGVRLRRTGHANEAVQVLDDADASARPEKVATQLVRIHLAHALRNAGDYRRAAEIYRNLLSGEFAAAARYWLSDYDFLNGRFAAALAALRGQSTQDAAEEGERLRLIGHVLRVNARFDEAKGVYTEAIVLARREDLAAAEAKALVNMTQTACWVGDMTSVSEAAERARGLLDLVPNPVELVKIRSSEAIVLGLTNNVDTAYEVVHDTRRLADQIGYRGGHNLADVAEILLDILTGNLNGARRTRSHLAERTRASGGNIYWIPIASSWIEGPEEALLSHSSIQWIDDPTVTLNRWAAIFPVQ
ncbi:hypothetical protein ABZ815_02110 [Nonomuraea sp. NPDC047529]|uniref:hypothetical protein n=1 Tax=Nonomuraea sp. NPDC047529 TaxID=3155623 RepID=UPI0033DF290F